MKSRRHFILTGRVQGVGLRYRSRYIAEQLRLTGWVKNIWDGCVEMELQGEVEDIDRFLAKLSAAPFIQIIGMECKSIPVKSEGGFYIR